MNKYSLIYADPPGKFRALLIGEAWGKHEHDSQHAFVGISGQELARMGGESGLFPSLLRTCKFCSQSHPFGRCENCGVFNNVTPQEMVEFWSETRALGIGVTNVFHTHPPADNIELFLGSRSDDVDLSFGPYRRGSKVFYVLKSHAHFLHQLHEEIRSLQPNLLILLGNTACWAVLGQVKITEIRGTVQETKFGIKALPTFHPASVVGYNRNWAFRPIIVADLIKAARESQAPSITRDQIWLEINPTLEDIENWFSYIPPPSLISCDIESGFVLYSTAELNDMKKHAPRARGLLAQMISMVGFAKSDSEGLVIPFLRRHPTTGALERYWETQSSEVRAWEWVQYGLSTGAELVFQNGLYDINRLLCHGMRPKNMAHDTMLKQHSHLPEMRKSLSFLASLYLDGVPSWKTMYGQGESLKRDD